MRDDEELGGLLEAALSSYADHEAAPGIDRRILTRVSAESTARQRRRKWWMIALPLAACLLLAVGLYRAIWPRPLLLNSSVNRIARPVSTWRTPDVDRGSAPPARMMGSRRPHAAASATIPSAAMSEGLPKLEVFPTPEPVSPDEEALLTYANRAPAEQRKALVDAQKQVTSPITIAAVHIPPLEPPDKSTP